LPVNPSALLQSRAGTVPRCRPPCPSRPLCDTRQVHGPGGQALTVSSCGGTAALSEIVRALPG